MKLLGDETGRRLFPSLDKRKLYKDGTHYNCVWREIPVEIV
jgi:hypothetical protein